MSERQTFTRLEKKSGAFCFLRSEKRPVKQTGSPMGTHPRNGNLSPGIPVRCFLLVSSWYGTTCWGITLLDMAVTHAYWCHSSIVVSVALLSTLRRLASRAVAAAVSLHLCSTSLRRHFSLLLRYRQLWSTCLSQDFSRALADSMRSWREGSSRPEKRPDSPQAHKSLSRAVIHTCVVQVVAVPVMVAPRKILSCSLFRHNGCF